ncbi:Centrosomal protein [Nymphon striatum]|nr:Centrosomal protein [Nymphon striatum]
METSVMKEYKLRTPLTDLAQMAYNQTHPKDHSEDDELTNLTWLQDTNLLKNISATTCSQNVTSTNPLLVDTNGNDITEATFDRSCLPSVTYSPTINVNSKPPYSYSCLIFMAIESSPNKALPVKDIYTWMSTNFPYFQTAEGGWKNSVRHNLSLNKCFMKVDKNMKRTIMVKGSYWSVDPSERSRVLHALRKSAHQPQHYALLLSGGLSQTVQNEILNSSLNTSSQPASPNSNQPSPGPEVDAAAAMIAMKNGHPIQDASIPILSDCTCKSNARRKNIRWTQRNKKRKTILIVTPYPSEDHSYSAGHPNSKSSSPSSSLDEAFSYSNTYEYNSDMSESDKSSFDYQFNPEEENDQGNNVDSLQIEMDEEQKKTAEGADALLDLAGVTTRSRKRKMSTYNKVSKL